MSMILLGLHILTPNQREREAAQMLNCWLFLLEITCIVNGILFQKRLNYLKSKIWVPAMNLALIL